MTDFDDETDAERTARTLQLSKADVSRMFAAKQYDQIEQARTEGRLDTLMTTTTTKTPKEN